MYRKRLYATIVLIFLIPAGLASAAMFQRYFEVSGFDSPSIMTVKEYVDQKITSIDEVSLMKIPKKEKVRRIASIVSDVEKYRKTNKMPSGFEEYTTDLRIKPFEFIPNEADVDLPTCLQAKDRVMINFDPTVEGFNTRLEPLKTALQVIDRICT